MGEMGRAGRILAVFVSLVLLVAACASPVGVKRSKPQQVQRYLTRNALTSDRPSDFTENELRRYDLLATWAESPTVAISNLHGSARAENFPPAALFALAELSFLNAEKTKLGFGYAAALVYAWALLFPEDGRPSIDVLDPRARVAADLYNRALTSTFQRDERSGVIQFHRADEMMHGGAPFALPFGRIVVSADPDALEKDEIEYYDLRPVTELAVTGIRNRYRTPGIGSPLAARARPRPGQVEVVSLGDESLVPLTAILTIDDPIAGLHSGELKGHLSVLASLNIEGFDYRGREIPLESEPTAALAASLAESQFWKKELEIFLGNAIGLRTGSALLGVRPYREGRIPVVFVHGTASSSARWADMINDMMADARLRDRYAFWTFTYDSGNPIAYSAMQLRKELVAAVDRADPGGDDPCARDMVVMGHSQGGLLTKLTVIDSGDRFWKDISDQDFEKLKLGKSQKQLLQDTLFVKPLPFVTEVLFLATPHKGSYLAGPQIVRRLAERLVRLPSDLVRLSADLVTILPQGAVGLTASRIPTSIDNMSPSNDFIQALSSIPVAPNVRSHSIIAIGKGDKPLDKSTDGVVRYESAHFEPVGSELTVRSPHSGMQAAPSTIEEVRRILLAHSAASACPVPQPAEVDESPDGKEPRGEG